MIPIEYYLTFAAILFAIGAYGVMAKPNTLIVLMCTELMLNAANINFIAFSAFMGDAYGQVMVIMTISVAAAEAAVSRSGEKPVLSLAQKNCCSFFRKKTLSL